MSRASALKKIAEARDALSSRDPERDPVVAVLLNVARRRLDEAEATLITAGALARRVRRR